ncbi:SurA N-terminal domain-containing protein [Bdellovibrionota bacterium FG-2]
MLTWIREKFGKIVIGSIIGFIAFVFVFSGVFNPKSTRGLHEGAVAGTVNGDSISISDFNRELNRRVEYFKAMTGGKLTDEQIQAFHLRDGVFQELARRKIMGQEAVRRKMIPSDDEIMDRIREIPAFQKDGHFDVVAYKQVLASNNYTPSSFERMMREDLSLQQWEGFFKARLHVSEGELRKSFATSRDKREIKYVLLNHDAGAKALVIAPDEIEKFLKDPAKLNLVKSRFDSKKDTEFKGKAFDTVKETLAREVLRSQKVDEISKINEKMAEQVLPLMGLDAASDAKVNAVLKPLGVLVKTGVMISRQAPQIPQVGEVKELVKDAFLKQSPIAVAQGGKAKRYSAAGSIIIAVVTRAEAPDFSKFDAERETLFKQVASAKERAVFEGWVKKLVEKAKIDTNPSVMRNEG